jgi:hypothetical protein
MGRNPGAAGQGEYNGGKAANDLQPLASQALKQQQAVGKAATRSLP